MFSETALTLYNMLENIMYFTVGFIGALEQIIGIYGVLKKRYGKESIIIEGKVIAISIQGTGLFKNYTPWIEYYLDGIKYKKLAIDSVSWKKNQYIVSRKVNICYNNRFKRNSILVRGHCKERIIYALIIIFLGLSLMMLAIIKIIN